MYKRQDDSNIGDIIEKAAVRKYGANVDKTKYNTAAKRAGTRMFVNRNKNLNTAGLSIKEKRLKRIRMKKLQAKILRHGNRLKDVTETQIDATDTDMADPVMTAVEDEPEPEPEPEPQPEPEPETVSTIRGSSIGLTFVPLSAFEDKIEITSTSTVFTSGTKQDAYGTYNKDHVKDINNLNNHWVANTNQGVPGSIFIGLRFLEETSVFGVKITYNVFNRASGLYKIYATDVANPDENTIGSAWTFAGSYIMKGGGSYARLYSTAIRSFTFGDNDGYNLTGIKIVIDKPPLVFNAPGISGITVFSTQIIQPEPEPEPEPEAESIQNLIQGRPGVGWESNTVQMTIPYTFNDVPHNNNDKLGLREGNYNLIGVTSARPIGFMIKDRTKFRVTAGTRIGTRWIHGEYVDYYIGNISFLVLGDFGAMSYLDFYYGWSGGGYNRLCLLYTSPSPRD